MKALSANKNRIIFWSLIFLLSFLINSIARSLENVSNLDFENYCVEEGLSQSALTSLLQDSKGFLWIGSGDGLNRYDGYDFKKFYGDREDSTSLSSSAIWKLFEDSEGYIWVATEYGLNRFDWSTERFKQFYYDPEDSNSLSNNVIWDIAEDRYGNLWIATQRGLNRYDKSKKIFTRFFFSPDSDDTNEFLSLCYDGNEHLYVGSYFGYYRVNIKTFEHTHFYIDRNDILNSPSNEINVIKMDKYGAIWLGTGNGLYKCLEEGKYQHFSLLSNKKKSISVFSILFDSDDKVWVGTYGDGLFLLDPIAGKFRQWKHNPYDKTSLVYDHISDMIFDRSKILWIATNFGLSKVDFQKTRFKKFIHFPGCENCLGDNIIWSILQDSQGHLWFGTDRGGVTQYDPVTDKFFQFRHDPKNKNSISTNTIMAIAEDSTGNLWFSAYEGGIDVLNLQTGQFIHFQFEESNPYSLSSKDIQSIYVDKKGRVWLGTAEGQLNYFDKKNNRFLRFPLTGEGENTFSWNYIWAIREDQNGNLLIGTEVKGLIRFNPETQIAENLSEMSPLKELQIYSIMSIYPDESGIIWLGTSDYGLIKYDLNKNRVYVYGKEQGLPNEMIYGILPEKDKISNELRALWLSTDKGLVRLDVKDDSIIVFQQSDGLPSDEFDSGAYFKARDGAMYFGTINGAIQFYPEKLLKRFQLPEVTITNFLLFNEPVKVSEKKNAILKSSITETREIVLKHNQNVFTIQFSMLYFRNQKRHRFQYQMAGLDDYWVDLGEKREVTFAHISPGNYELRVRGTSSDGQASKKITSLKIRIIPPIYKRRWFLVASILFMLALAISWHKRRTAVVRRRSRELEKLNLRLNKEIQERKEAQEKIAASLREKEVLLKEIHHRVKNNLQVTSSLLYLQSKNVQDDDARGYLQEAQNRIKSMAMIHEKLYRSEIFAKINSRDYIRDLAVYVYNSYSGNSKKIRLNINVEPIDFDLDSAIPCGLILNELLSNAIKYAFPDGRPGQIEVTLRELENDKVELRVRDDGVGLPEDLDLHNSDSLGLKLVKSLTDQLEGEFDFKSNGGFEARITFDKPVVEI